MIYSITAGNRSQTTPHDCQQALETPLLQPTTGTELDLPSRGKLIKSVVQTNTHVHALRHGSMNVYGMKGIQTF